MDCAEDDLDLSYLFAESAAGVLVGLVCIFAVVVVELARSIQLVKDQ